MQILKYDSQMVVNVMQYLNKLVNYEKIFKEEKILKSNITDVNNIA